MLGNYRVVRCLYALLSCPIYPAVHNTSSLKLATCHRHTTRYNVLRLQAFFTLICLHTSFCAPLTLNLDIQMCHTTTFIYNCGVAEHRPVQLCDANIPCVIPIEHVQRRTTWCDFCWRKDKRDRAYGISGAETCFLPLKRRSGRR